MIQLKLELQDLHEVHDIDGPSYLFQTLLFYNNNCLPNRVRCFVKSENVSRNIENSNYGSNLLLKLCQPELSELLLVLGQFWNVPS